MHFTDSRLGKICTTSTPLVMAEGHPGSFWLEAAGHIPLEPISFEAKFMTFWNHQSAGYMQDLWREQLIRSCKLALQMSLWSLPM